MLLISYICQQEDFQEYGIDWGGPLPDGEHDGPPQSDGDLVDVPDTLLMDQQKLDVLMAEINPSEQSDNYGIDLYLRTVVLVERLTLE